MPEKCLADRECQQYCQVLNSLTGEEQQMPCAWPEKIADGYDLGSSLNPELAQRASTRILRILNTGSNIQEQLHDQGSELAIAYEQQDLVFNKRLSLWEGYASAARQGRKITDIEVIYFAEQIQKAVEHASVTYREAGVGRETAMLAQAMYDRKTLEDYSLLFDGNMIKVVTELCANASVGQSTLLIGDKGIAKTQAAKFVSGLYSQDGKAKFISGDGNMMKDEFIGKMTLEEQNGATVTTFQPGILTYCMENGVPLVMDEINAIDPAITMRLQDILLRKPGDTITLQEDGGEIITIKQGFCVIATANEAS